MADEAPGEAERCITDSCEAPERDERNMEEDIINELNNNPDMNCNRSQGKDVLEKCRKKESKWCSCKKCIQEEEVHYLKVHDNDTSAMVELQRFILLAIVSWVASTANQDEQSSSDFSDDDSASDAAALVVVETERQRFSLTTDAADISESEVDQNESLEYSSIEVQPSPFADDMYPTTSYSDFISVEMDSESIRLEQSEGDSLGQSEGGCSWEPDSDGPSTAMECHLPAAAVHAEDDSEDSGIVFGSLSLDTSPMKTEVDEGTSGRSCGASDLVPYRQNHISNYEVETPSSQLAVLMSSHSEAVGYSSFLTMRVFSSDMASSDVFTQLTVMDPSQYHSIAYYLHLKSEYLHNTWVIPSLTPSLILEALALPSITLAIAVYSVKLALAIFLVSFVVAYCRVVFSCTSSLLFMHRQLQQRALEPPTDVIDELIVSPMDNVHSHVMGRVVRAVHRCSEVSASHDIQAVIHTATISNHVGGICEYEVESPAMIGMVRQKALLTGSIGLDDLYHVKCTWWREHVQVFLTTPGDVRVSIGRRIQVGRICGHFAASMFIEDMNIPVLSQVNELEETTVVSHHCSLSTTENPPDSLPLQLVTSQHFNSPPELEPVSKNEVFRSQNLDVAHKVNDLHVFAFPQQLEHSGVLYSNMAPEYLSIVKKFAVISDFHKPLKLFAGPGPSDPCSLLSANISSLSLESPVSTPQRFLPIEPEGVLSLIPFQQSSAAGACVAQSPAIFPFPYLQKSLTKPEIIDTTCWIFPSSRYVNIFLQSVFEWANLRQARFGDISDTARVLTSFKQHPNVSANHEGFAMNLVRFNSAYPLANIKVSQIFGIPVLVFYSSAEAAVLSLWVSLEMLSSSSLALTTCDMRVVMVIQARQVSSTHAGLLGTHLSMVSTNRPVLLSNSTIHFSAMELESWHVIGKMIDVLGKVETNKTVTHSRLRSLTAHCRGDNCAPQLRPVINNLLSRWQQNSLLSTTSCIPGVTAVVKHLPSSQCDSIPPMVDQLRVWQQRFFELTSCIPGPNPMTIPSWQVSLHPTNGISGLTNLKHSLSVKHSLILPTQCLMSVKTPPPSFTIQQNSVQPLKHIPATSIVKPVQHNPVQLNLNPTSTQVERTLFRFKDVSVLFRKVPEPTSDLSLRVMNCEAINQVHAVSRRNCGHFSSGGTPYEDLDVGESTISIVEESDSKPTMLNKLPLIPSSTSHVLFEGCSPAPPCSQLVNKSIDEQILVKQHATSGNDSEGADDCSNQYAKRNRGKQDFQDLKSCQPVLQDDDIQKNVKKNKGFSRNRVAVNSGDCADQVRKKISSTSGWTSVRDRYRQHQTLCQFESPGDERREQLARNEVCSSGNCGESVRKKRYSTTKERNDCHQNLPSSQPNSLENERREKLARSEVGSGHWNSVRKKQALENGGGDEVNHTSLRMLSSFPALVWIFTFFSFVPAAYCGHGLGPYPTNTLWDNFLNFLISVLEMLADPTSQDVLAALFLILLVALIVVFVWVQSDCRDNWYRSRSPQEQVLPAVISTPQEEVGLQGESTTSSAFPCTDNGTNKPIQEENADPVSQYSLLKLCKWFLYSEPSAKEGNHEHNERDILIGEGNDDQKNELQCQPNKFVSTKSLQNSCDVSTVGYGNEERSSDSFHDIAITSSQGVASHDASSDTNSNPPSLIATGTALDDLACDGPRHGIASESAESGSDVSPSGYGWGEDGDRSSEESSASNPRESSVDSAAAADVFQDIGEEEETQNSDFCHIFPESCTYQPSQSEVAGLPALTPLCPLSQSEIAGLPALTLLCPLHHNCEDDVEAPLIEGINEVEIVDEVQNVIGAACTSEVTLPCQGDLEARVVNVEPPLEMASLVLADPGGYEDPLPVPVDPVPEVLVDEPPTPCLTDQGYVQPFVNPFGQGSEDCCQDRFYLEPP